MPDTVEIMDPCFYGKGSLFRKSKQDGGAASSDKCVAAILHSRSSRGGLDRLDAACSQAVVEELASSIIERHRHSLQLRRSGIRAYAFDHARDANGNRCRRIAG